MFAYACRSAGPPHGRRGVASRSHRAEGRAAANPPTLSHLRVAGRAGFTVRTALRPAGFTHRQPNRRRSAAPSRLRWRWPHPPLAVRHETRHSAARAGHPLVVRRRRLRRRWEACRTARRAHRHPSGGGGPAAAEAIHQPGQRHAVPLGRSLLRDTQRLSDGDWSGNRSHRSVPWQTRRPRRSPGTSSSSGLCFESRPIRRAGMSST